MWSRNIEGWVDFEGTVDERGHLIDIVVTGASNDAFIDPAHEAFHLFRFRPPLSDGRPVRVRVTTRIDFRLQDEAG
jgi:TonB family protein